MKNYDIYDISSGQGRFVETVHRSPTAIRRCRELSATGKGQFIWLERFDEGYTPEWVRRQEREKRRRKKKK